MKQDMHVHSTFSDGRGSLLTNISAAQARGLDVLGCVDHVRVSTAWLPAFVSAIDAARNTTDIALVCGIEAKILDTQGRLDMPCDISGVDRIFAADHQVPTPVGCEKPVTIRHAFASGATTPTVVVAGLVESYLNCMRANPGRIVIAHAFSVLPKIGLDETHVTVTQLEALAECARETESIIEIDERWSCPGERFLRACRHAGVTIWASTDAHKPVDIGRFDYVAEMGRKLELDFVA